MRVNVKHSVGLSLLVLALMGCSQREADDALDGYTAQCSETGSARNTMSTKLVGQPFSMDVALIDKKTGALATLTNDLLGQVTSVTADLTEATSQAACEDGIAAIADLNVGGVVRSVLNLTKNLTSKQTLSNLSVSQPHKQLYCRANILSSLGNLTRKCAAASFAVRPANFVLEVVEPAGIKKVGGNMIVAAGEGGNAASAKASFTLKVKAVGLNNTLNALTGFTGSTLNLDLTNGAGLLKLAALNKPGSDASAGNLSVKGVLSPASFVFNNGEATAKLTYSEVGFLRLDQGALLDPLYAKSDADAGRCVANSTSNTPNAQGQIGCLVGSTLASLPIKFVPFKLKVASPVTKTVENAANTCNRFAYFGGELTTAFALQAVNSAGNVTRNYSKTSGLALFNAADYDNYNIPDATARNSLNQNVTIGFDKSTANNAITATDWVEGATNITLKHRSDRPLLPVLPTQLTLKASPTDGEIDTTGVPADNMSTAVEFRYGRVKLSNAYGSETMPLTYEVRADYFKDNAWALNSDDSCSMVSADMFKVETPTDQPKNKITQCRSTLGVKNAGVFNGGVAQVNITPPGNGNNGWFYVTMKQDENAASNDEACVTGVGRIKAKVLNATPQFGRVNPEKALVSFGQYKSKMIYSGEQ